MRVTRVVIAAWLAVWCAVSHATEKPVQTGQAVHQATKSPAVDPELLKAIERAAAAGKKPCPCQKGAAK